MYIFNFCLILIFRAKYLFKQKGEKLKRRGIYEDANGHSYRLQRKGSAVERVKQEIPERSTYSVPIL